MKTQNKIADDPVNGSFREQFRWCKNNGLVKFPGPLVDMTPAFPCTPALKSMIGKFMPVNECGKFGGICHSGTCRDGHQAVT